MTSTGPGRNYKDGCPGTPELGGIVGLRQQIGNHSTNNAQEMREDLCNFFNTTGAVEWQNHLI